MFSLFSDADVFINESRTSRKFQQKGITVRELEHSRSIKVENLPPQHSVEVFELYFEKWGGDVEKISILTEEQAAIVTFKEQEGKNLVLSKGVLISVLL